MLNIQSSGSIKLTTSEFKVQNSVRISVALATFNEEKNIARCLKSVSQWSDEVVVVDGSSTDNTREIAKKYGAKVYKTTNPLIFHINKQKALDKCKNKWILQLDADEVVTKELQKEISEVLNSKFEIRNSGVAGYYIPRLNYFLGKPLRKGGQYPDYVIRLVRKDKANFPCKSVHEQIEVDGETGYLKNPLRHFSTPTIKRYWINANRYTTLRAKDMHKQGIKVNFSNTVKYIFFKPVYEFLLRFVRHKGFLDSWRGFLFALFSGLDWSISYLKLIELDKKK